MTKFSFTHCLTSLILPLVFFAFSLGLGFYAAISQSAYMATLIVLLFACGVMTLVLKYKNQKEGLQKQKREFLNRLNHEINTPLTKGHILLQSSESNNHEQIQNILIKIQSSVNRISKLESYATGELQLKTNQYRLIDVFDEVCDGYENKVSIDSEFTGEVKVDFELFTAGLKSIIEKLISRGCTHIRIKQNESAIIITAQSQKAVSIVSGSEEYAIVSKIFKEHNFQLKERFDSDSEKILIEIIPLS